MREFIVKKIRGQISFDIDILVLVRKHTDGVGGGGICLTVYSCLCLHILAL